MMTDDSMKEIVIKSKYEIGEVVYLRVRPEKNYGMVTGLSVRQSGITYAVTWEDANEKWHYDCELSSEFTPRFE